MPLEKTEVYPGMQVQDADGKTATVRWIGRMEKAQRPPNSDVGTYAAVEFVKPHSGLQRCNGTWPKEGGQVYCACPEGSVEFIKPRFLDREKNTAGIQALRAQGGGYVEFSDEQIVKFLIARNYEIAQSNLMVKNHVTWRSTFKPSSDEYFLDDMMDLYPAGFGGVDREGNILYMERPGNGGKHSPKDLVNKMGVEALVRWHTAGMETGRKLMAERGCPRVTAIIDLSNMGDAGGKTMDMAKAISKIDQDNYPEHLSKMFLINAPTMFSFAWKVIRVFLDARTKAKIHVLSSSEYAKKLEECVDRRYWPSFAGGADDSWLSRGGRIGGLTQTGSPRPIGSLVIEPVSAADIAAADKNE